MTGRDFKIDVLQGGEFRPMHVLPRGDDEHLTAHSNTLLQAIQAAGAQFWSEEVPDSPGAEEEHWWLIPSHETDQNLLVFAGGQVCKLRSLGRGRQDTAMRNMLHLLRVTPNLPERLSERVHELSEDRIQKLMDMMLDSDPFGPVEARIDASNAALRTEFLKDYPVLDSAQVHERAGLTGSNKSQTVNTWRQKGWIIGLPIRNKIGYPAFQFDADGRPFALVPPVLKALPRDYTPWQKVFWMVSAQEDLDGKTPVEALLAGDDRVIEAAAHADELPAG